MQCFVCNTGVELSAERRVGFRDACDQCGSDLHICRNCSFYDSTAYNECRETSAERVPDSERANHCDWFRASEETGGRRTQASHQAELDALFKK